MASRSKSARPARSEATARTVGISAGRAEMRISTTEAPLSGTDTCEILPSYRHECDSGGLGIPLVTTR